MSDLPVVTPPCIINPEFYASSVATMKEISKWKMKPITLFPESEIITDGDIFFKRIWSMIDSSNHYFWLTTYAFDSSPAADTTLLKLISASKRGVNVVLLIDNVQAWPKRELVEEFEQCGGRFHILNTQFGWKDIKKYFSKTVWCRHHEKLIVSDGRGLIGSSNIEGDYGGVLFGSRKFQDLNYYTEHIILEDYRKYFLKSAKLYNIQLHPLYNNEQYLQQLDIEYPSSEFYTHRRYTLLHNDMRGNSREIENSVLKMVTESKEEIKIIQPYYYPLRRFDKTVRDAVRRGVNVSILTTSNRDQNVFKSMYNYMLFRRLRKYGLEVYETRERFLHSKCYLSDGRYVNLGSMNNDRWSWNINNELNILIDDPREYRIINAHYEELLSKSRRVQPNVNVGLFERLTIHWWRVFLLLSEAVMSRITVEDDGLVVGDENDEASIDNDDEDDADDESIENNDPESTSLSTSLEI